MNICSHVDTDDLPLPPFCRWDIRCGRRHCQLLHLERLPGVSAPVGLATPSHTPRATVIWWHRGSSCWDPWRVDRPCSSKQTLLWLRISHSTTAPSRRSQRAHRAVDSGCAGTFKCESAIFLFWSLAHTHERMHRVKFTTWVLSR